jgi:hypothetical protein
MSDDKSRDNSKTKADRFKFQYLQKLLGNKAYKGTKTSDINFALKSLYTDHGGK